ncbi:L,D-transpeptidase family protein [Bacillaceae bacterium IKA-2]|nr:L,D-transpeptidase family protein [Bacillaceae bacterium IKA-2]
MLKKFLLFSFVLCFLFAFLLPRPTSASSGQFIIINKASNELAYYENNKLNRIFRVATGKSPSLTPEGNFKIVNKIVDRPYFKDNIPGGDPSNPLGSRWLGLNARDTWGTTYAIHGNNNPASIGNYVSLGCIRMQNDEVKWLFDKVKVDTPVIIVTASSSFDSIAKANGHTVTASTIEPAPVKENTVLSLGSRGGDVKELQQTLQNLGYKIEEISGVFDEKTEKEVQKFQADHGLTFDGIVGQETKKALKNPSKKVSTTPTPAGEKPSDTTDPPKKTKQISPEKVNEFHEYLRKSGYYVGDYHVNHGTPTPLMY